MNDSESNKLIVPGAVIIAGLIIAGAIIYERKPSTPANTGENQPAAIGKNQPPGEPSPAESPSTENLKPVTENDHILGSPNAPLTLVLFTDLECSFCKRFHNTMKQVMDEYGKTGKLKWVMRHFPLDIHPKAKNEAIATECAADLGGKEKFWPYLDRLFEITPSNNGLDPNELPKIAEYVGLDKARFEKCLTSGKFDERVKENSEDALKSGAMGTPYAIVIGPNGKKSAIPGALPYSDVKTIIDEMLAGN